MSSAIDSPPSTSSVSSSPTTTISSRKRQRSQSANSETEEALKRGSPRPQIDSLTISDTNNTNHMDVDAEMDSYMQEQGHLEQPTPAEKLARIDQLKQLPLALDQTWFLVDRAWFGRWRAALDPKEKAEPISENQLGPPSTTALLDEFGNLKPSLTEEIDFELLPEEAWKLLAEWYGSPPKPLPRYTISRGISFITVELYPPLFHIYRLTKDEDATETNLDTPPPAAITMSARATVKDLCDAAVSAVHNGAGVDPSPSRVWRINDADSSHPTRNLPISKFASAGLLDATIDATKTLEDASLQSMDAFAVEFQDHSTHKWIVKAESEEASTPEPLFKSNDGFFNRMSGESSSSLFSSSKPNGDAKSDADKKMVVIAKKEQIKEQWLEPGTLGLGNMGNTCFMNSAIQCLGHQKELTEYFLTGVYMSELNRDNPLGMGGEIAEGFSALLTRMWAGSELAQTHGALDKLREESGDGARNKVSKFFGRSNSSGFGGFGGFGGGGALNPSSTSYTPREFKSQLARFAPQFSGYQQHDSQELVAFLLDGLHEDLNRVLKKPYVEKPDWFGARPPVLRPFRERRTAEKGGEEEDKEEYQREKEEYEAKEREAYVKEHGWDAEVEEDREMLRFARESWGGYKKRNDSVIVDLFQGQYRSTLVCPECQKVSITFDPFMYLTLPLPIQKKWRGSVYYVPWDLEKPHLKIAVELGRDASFRDLRVLLGRWMKAPPENLLTLESFSHKFYKSLDDNVLCGEMGENDLIICFELPCNSQQSRTWKRSEHPDDPWVLPMLLCEAPVTNNSATGSYGVRSYPGLRSGSLFGYPTVVVVTKEQAKSAEGIYAAAVDRLARWTKQQRDLWKWELPDGFSVPAVEEKVETVRLDAMEEDAVEMVTEFGEDGAVVNVTQPVPPRQQPTPPTPPEEGDIVDEKGMMLDLNDNTLASGIKSAAPVRLGPKQDLFNVFVSAGSKEYGTTGYTSHPMPLDSRIKEAQEETEGDLAGVLLRDNDVLLCEFDENMKAYYFGEERRLPKFEHALWETWDDFFHPEYQESVKAAESKRHQGISLSDCLDEFVKEEQLGADDLWYCPQCKKHQQATKKFDLWSTPDILVVHLKRFSNSRMLRDKIDAFVDFPVEGLDLNERVNERLILSKLKARGVDTEAVELLGDGETGQSSTEEPLIYDLFAVDEHLGGLGGGHYRAYAQNHMNGKWYHFDDSFVSESAAKSAVNANAYLLFYRRRTSSPIGGKSASLVEKALQDPPQSSLPPSTPDEDSDNNDIPDLESPNHADIQLPTPPNEPDYRSLPSLGPNFTMANWQNNQLRSRGGLPSPPLDDEPPDFDPSYQDAPMRLFQVDNSYSYSFFPDPSSSAADSSPTSSVGVEPDVEGQSDIDGECEEEVLSSGSRQVRRSREGGEVASPIGSGSMTQISSGDDLDDMNPFADDRHV